MVLKPGRLPGPRLLTHPSARPVCPCSHQFQTSLGLQRNRGPVLPTYTLRPGWLPQTLAPGLFQPQANPSRLRLKFPSSPGWLLCFQTQASSHKLRIQDPGLASMTQLPGPPQWSLVPNWPHGPRNQNGPFESSIRKPAYMCKYKIHSKGKNITKFRILQYLNHGI